MMLLCKYADDTYLLVPASNSSSIPQEIQHITNWATANNVKVTTPNHRKWLSISRVGESILPILLPSQILFGWIKWTYSVFTVSDTLTFHHHISALVAKSARSFHALKTIRAYGLVGNALWDVTRATLVSQLLYASFAWWGSQSWWKEPALGSH